jgi:hypothetical protein
MSQIRGALTAIAFVLLSAVALAAMVQTITYGLPNTLASSASALIAALASQDLSRATRSDKVKLGERLERELSEGVDWPAELTALTEPQRQRLVNNVAELAKESFDAKVEHYFRLSEKRRTKFLDRHVDEILHWAVLLDRVGRAEGESLIGPAALAGLMMRVNQWYSAASPEELARMQQFQKALGEQMTKRLMRRFRPNEN